MKKHRFLLIALILALPAKAALNAQDTNAPQSWTASDGRVIQAKFVKLDGESVVIEKDGKAFSVPFAKLNPESVAKAKRLGGVIPATVPESKPDHPTFDPTGTDPIKPLWVLPAQALADPGKAQKPFREYTEQFVTKSGNLVFIFGGNSEEEPAPVVVMVSGTNGKVLWRTVLPDSPEGTTEWKRGMTGTQDGSVVACTVTTGKNGDKSLGNALIHLRQMDGTTGKLTGHRQMAVNDPNSTDEPKDAKWLGGMGDFDMSANGDKVLLANPFLVAEVDVAQGKVLRSSKVPETLGRFMYSCIVSNGAYAFWNSDPDTNMVKAFAIPGEEPQAVPSPKPGWKVVSAEPHRGAKSAINVLCQSPDKQNWAAGAYDPVTKKWVWVKTDAELATPIPGSAKNLSSLGFDGRVADTDGEKYRRGFLVDADTGELRYKTEYDGHLLADGRRWMLTSEFQAKKGQPVEARLVNLGNGNVEAQIPRSKPFRENYHILFRPDGNVVMAEVNAGNIEVEVISAARKALFPLRKVAVELPSPPKSASLFTFGFDDFPAVLLEVGSLDGSKHYCAIPLPGK